jgi:RNA recognition motif-containing protein
MEGNPRIFLGCLSRNVTEDMVRETFGKYGRVSDITLKEGYGFLTYDNEFSANKAIRMLNRT